MKSGGFIIDPRVKVTDPRKRVSADVCGGRESALEGIRFRWSRPFRP